MHKLNQNEIDTIYGGVMVFGVNVNAEDFVKTGLVTSKKLSMVYCIGKEAKTGIQNLDIWCVLRAGSCIFSTSLAREIISANLIKNRKSKKD